ncbi:MAG: HD-GYP domain-containing protein [Coriobacteriia bacterium]
MSADDHGALSAGDSARSLSPGLLRPDVREAPPATYPAVRIPPTLEPQVVLSCLREAAAPLGSVASTHLWLADNRSATLRMLAAAGPFAPHGQPILFEDDDPLAHAYRDRRVSSGAIARLRIGGESTTTWRYALPIEAGAHRGVAAIDVHAVIEPDSGMLPEVTAPLLGSLSGTLALYVADIELMTARSLIEAARELSRMLDPSQVLETALSRAMEMTGAQTGSIMLLDRSTGRLRIEVSRGLPEEVVRDTELGEGEGIAGWVLATGQPLLVEDLLSRSPAARRHGVRSAVSAPLADDDGTLGVLNVGSRSFPARFTDTHLDTVALLAKQSATALRNARAVEESRAIYFDTLKALALALETKDPYSRGGTERVLEYADALGGVFDLSDDDMNALRIAALLHDIGMASVGDGVTHCDRPLTTIERALLKLHPQIAADILTEAPALRGVVPIVYHHHEWFDGHGYGSGVAGESIPVGARILAVADAFVAMTSDRPYRGPFSVGDALAELEEKAGTQFDPSVVAALGDILRGGTNRVPGPNSRTF